MRGRGEGGGGNQIYQVLNLPTQKKDKTVNPIILLQQLLSIFYVFTIQLSLLMDECVKFRYNYD